MNRGEIMAFDAGLLYAVVSEINEMCREGKVERICQPTKDEIDIILHKGKESRILVISASSNAPRVALSSESKENPIVAPMFCMLMRKHLSGAKLERCEIVGFDRVAKFVFSAYDEMGFQCEKTVVAEIMGRCSNIIFVSSDNKVISAIKPVDFSVSSKRQVLPGMKYELPPTQDKINPLECDRDKFFKIMTDARDLAADKAIQSRFFGVSTQAAREIVYRACADITATAGNVAKSLSCALYEWFSSLKEGRVTPTIAFSKDKTPLEYSYQDITYMGDAVERKHYGSFADMLDAFYAERERAERIARSGADISAIINHALSRLTKKIEKQTIELAESERKEEYKRYGDLITANIYAMRRGMESFSCTDYYSSDCATVDIPLDKRLTPSQNAQKMYRLYNKAKNTQKYVTEQIKEARSELEYLLGVKSFLSNAVCENDLSEIREELFSSGYGKRIKATASQKNKKKKMPLTEYTTSGGYRLLCGRNNLQNEYITFKVADKGDLWFHVKGKAGSHVVLICNGEEPSEKDYTEASEIAAYYSTAERGTMTEVDYTRVKNLKKPASAKPGYVIYHTNYSAYVMPKLPADKHDE